MIYFIIGIIIFNLIAFYLIKDINDYLKYSSLIAIIAGYATIVFNYFLKYFINNQIFVINVSKVTKLIYQKTISRGLILILIGGIELIIYIILNYLKKYRYNVKIAN
jgi:hypothetical protein